MTAAVAVLDANVLAATHDGTRHNRHEYHATPRVIDSVNRLVRTSRSARPARNQPPKNWPET